MAPDPGSTTEPIDAARRTTPRGDATRRRILDEASEVFGKRGYAATRLEDVAVRVGLSRPAVLRHFSSKEELFIAVYKHVMVRVPTWFSEPDEVLEQGFYEVLRYWFGRATKGDSSTLPYRIYYIGRYCCEMSTQKAVADFTRSEDPERTLEFVEWGMRRGEVDPSLDRYLAAAFIEWVADGFESSAFSEEFDRGGVFRRGAARNDRSERAVEQAIEILRRALEPRGAGESS
jgi:AcrR family transcriptional regulator